MCKMSLKTIEKLLNKVFFFMNRIRIIGRAGPSPNYVGEGSDFFISNSKKALNTRLFWGTGEDGIGKCPIHQNSCYQETSSTTN